MAKTGWAICYDKHGPRIVPVVNSCRTHDCCGGKECGFSIEEAQKVIVDYYQMQASHMRVLTTDQFLELQGYSPELGEKQ